MNILIDVAATIGLFWTALAVIAAWVVVKTAGELD